MSSSFSLSLLRLVRVALNGAYLSFLCRPLPRYLYITYFCSACVIRRYLLNTGGTYTADTAFASKTICEATCTSINSEVHAVGQSTRSASFSVDQAIPHRSSRSAAACRSAQKHRGFHYVHCTFAQLHTLPVEVSSLMKQG